MWSSAVVVVLAGTTPEKTSWAAGDEGATDILEITVGAPTVLSDLTYQNNASLSRSRTGVVAAFYSRRLGKQPQYYRISTDNGVTWGPEKDSPAVLAGGTAGATLRGGGVLKFLTGGVKPKGEAEERVAPLAGEYKDGWYNVHSTFAWFNDDFTYYEVAPVDVYMPDAVVTKQTHLPMSTWPMFADDKMIQLDDGDLLTVMQGIFKGDTRARTILCRSNDRGHKWRYYATVAIQEQDPNPDLPGWYLGHCEPTVALLPGGDMICVMRTQYAHYPGEYRPMHVSWSSDMGKSWTQPVLTQPYLTNISPELAVLDNGVVACQYGRPGFHVAFSLDNGHTWQDRISFSHLPEPYITGQFDMIKVGPNKLLAIGNETGGRPELWHRGYPKPDTPPRGSLKVWPIHVERVTVSNTRVSLQGRVLDEQGTPVFNAKIERSPNRYLADDWYEAAELDLWKAGPRMIGNPQLAFRSIQERHDHPTVRTNTDGRFRFDDVRLGEYVLTVEAHNYAPQHRHVHVRPKPDPQEFTLKRGILVRNRVIDADGNPISGVCVVLNRWHCHTDHGGVFHWSVETPLPKDVTLRVDKRYSGEYETLERTLALSQLENQPVTLKNR